MGDNEVLLVREQPAPGGMEGGERDEVWEANVGWKEEESSGKRTMGVRNKKG